MEAAGIWVVPAKKGIVNRLYAIGDCHIGNAGCAIEKLREDVERAHDDKDSVVLLMGDLADYIGPDDNKRWDPSTITPDVPVKKLAQWGQYLAECVVNVFRPLKGKIIGSLYGNHEHQFMRRAAAEQLHNWVCTELGTRNLGYCCFFNLSFRRGTDQIATRSYRVFAHHGAGSARTAGGKMNRLVSFMLTNEADVYLVGHLHERDVKRIDTLATDKDCKEIKSRKRLGVFTGTYLRTYNQGPESGYGERAGYVPVPLGCSVIEFNPWRHDGYTNDESVSARVVI